MSLRINGSPAQVVAELCGLSRSAVNRLHKRFLLGGWDAVHALGEAPFPTHTRRLSKEQEHAILSLVHAGTPDRLGERATLWDKEMLATVINGHIGDPLHSSTLSVYMRRWGFLSEKVYRKAYRDAPLRMKAWMKGTYPLVAAQARTMRAQLHWIDVAPLVPLEAGSPDGPFLIESSTNRGRSHWMVCASKPTPAQLVDFLERLMRDGTGTFFFLLKQAQGQPGARLVEWSQRHTDRVRLFDLPASDTVTPSEETIP